MIVMDLSQIMLASLMKQMAISKNNEMDMDLFRHMCLNKLRSLKVKFKKDYGELVIAADGRNTWRKQAFPYYKFRRAKDRAASAIDWKQVYQYLNTIHDELAEWFPYAVIRHDNAEADDVIATLVMEFGDDKPIMILSNDGDYMQLHTYKYVKQFDPINRKLLRCDDPKAYLHEHILKGDAGDGIPNFLSDDDTFVLGKRQRPLTAKRILQYTQLDPFFGNDGEARNYHRNRLLIDMSMVPETIRTDILASYEAQKDKKRPPNFNQYFMEHGLRILFTVSHEF
jgi:hypothetical protein